MKRIIPSLLLICFVLVIPAQAEDNFFVIESFEKGLNSHISSYLTSKNQCTIAQNVRFNEQFGSVAKRYPMLAYGTIGDFPITSLHRYYNSDSTAALLATGSTYLYLGSDTAGTFSALADSLSDGARWQYVTYSNIAIGMNGTDKALKYDGKTTITANTDEARSASNLCAELGAPFAELNTGSNLDASSWYQYKVAFYDGTTYSYSTARSNPILTGSTVRDITLTDIPLGPNGTTTRYIYRTVGNASRATVLADTTYYRCTTISDNTTTTFNDTVVDGTLDDDTAPTWTTVSAGTNATPPLGKYPIIHDERLFISGNSTYLSDIFYSLQYNPNYFDPTDYVEVRSDDGDSITFLKEQLGILTIGKTNTIQKFYTEGDPDTDWYISDPFSFIGCPAPYTAVSSPIGIIYLGRDGLYAFNGQNSQYISDAVTPQIRDILKTNFDNAVGAFVNNEYHLSYTSGLSGEAINNRVLIYDLTRDAFTLDTKYANCFCVFNSGTDYGILYIGSSNADGYIYAYRGSPFQLAIRTKSEFEDGIFDDMRVIGTEEEPSLELAWDCTINGWLTELQTKDASINTLDDIGTYLPDATIDRPDTDGTWTSPVYEIGASDLDKLYWNEHLGSTGDVTFNIRLGATSAACQAASWSDAVSDPLGSDISETTGNTYIQLRANFSTTDIDYTPTLNLSNTFVIKLTYSKAGQVSETAVSSMWQSGWTNFGIEGHKKRITRIKVFYEGTSGTLKLTYANDEGDVDDSFNIDLSIDPPYDADNDGENEYTGGGAQKIYTFYPPAGDGDTDTPIGEWWDFTLEEDGVVFWLVDRIQIKFSDEGIY